MKTMRFAAILLGVLMTGLVTTPSGARAQNEAALRAHFEGKAVTLLMDMPGTNEGVNVPVGKATDFKEYGSRLKRYGVALHAGDRAVVTLVKVKKDLIEFQLAGGGYGTMGDDTSTSVSIPFVEKSPLEVDLEKQAKDEKDPVRRRFIERDIEEMRRYRERENRRITAEREMIADYKQRLLAIRRQQGGSRFNIRYDKNVPPAAQAEDVMVALKEFVDFTAMNVPITVDRPRDPEADSRPRKGMLRLDAERLFGAATDTSERSEGALIVVTATYLRGSEKITAEFVEDVMIKFVIGRAR